MRNELEILLKEELRMLAIRTRDCRNLTQRNMAKILVMSESSYSDIETGVSMCGTLTTLLLLIAQEDPTEYLLNLQMKFQSLYNRAMQPI